MWTKSFRNTDDRPEPRLYTHDTQFMPAGDGTKCSMLMEGLCLMHISWPLGPLSLFFFLLLWCHFSRILFVYLCPFLSLCSFCLLLLGFREQLWKAHIYTLKYAEKQSSPNKPDVAFSSEDFAVGWIKPRRFLLPEWLEARCFTPVLHLFFQTLTSVRRMWRDETPSWRVRSRAPRRHLPPARRSRRRRRWRCGASSRSWTSRFATWVSWGRAWPSSSPTSHRSKWAVGQGGSTAGTRDHLKVPPLDNASVLCFNATLGLVPPQNCQF